MCKVSVLMPVYRTKEEYLKEAIESILGQTFKDFELLILDDCPEDPRENIVKCYKEERIVYLKNEKNLGISASRNKLIDLAKGEYLAVFDHDDISFPERLKKQVEFLDNNQDYGVVSGQQEFFVGKNRFSNYPNSNLEIKKALMYGNVVAHTALMLRKSVLEKTNIRYEEKYSPCEDYMLVLRLIEHTMFYNFSEPLVKYRNLEGNTSHLKSEKMEDRAILCNCYAFKNYPYLYEQNKPINSVGYKSYYLKLFKFIPFAKVKINQYKLKVYLFGFILLFSMNKK